MLADDIINFRARHGLKQKELAKMLGISQQTLCSIEKGNATTKFTEAKIRIFMEEYKDGE